MMMMCISALSTDAPTFNVSQWNQTSPRVLDFSRTRRSKVPRCKKAGRCLPHNELPLMSLRLSSHR